MKPTLKQRLMKPMVALTALAALGAGAAGTLVASAATSTTGTSTTAPTHGMGMRHMGGGVMGTVVSLSGNTLMVAGKDGTTYSVDITNAKFLKFTAGSAPTTITSSGITVGDTVGVRGTVTGTSVVATEVTDGIPSMGQHMGMMGGRGKGPGVMGTVASVSGNTVTVTGSDGKTYTVDATGADVEKTTTITTGDIKVGDSVGVMGTVSGTSVKAAHIMDGVHAPKN